MAQHILKDLIFKNPMNLPLEKLYLKIKTKQNKDQEIKALDTFWIVKHFYPCYIPMPCDIKQLWLPKANSFIKVLEYLNDLPFYKFWSYVLYVPGVHQMLDSFLEKALPSYKFHPPVKFQAAYYRIYDLVLQMYKKILTPRISESEYITPKTLGKFLDDNHVITQNVLWDISRIYGYNDDGTIADLFQFAYENIPSLKSNLIESVYCLADIFEAIGTAAYESETPTEIQVTNLTYLLFDTAFSINMFMKLYPPFRNICLAEQFVSKIVHTYESEIPLLHLFMKAVYINDRDPGYDRVDNARVELLEICHHLFSYVMDMILQTQDTETEQKIWIEKYLNLLNIIGEHMKFLNDYDCAYSVSQDIETLMVICPNIDQNTCNNIQSSVKKSHEEIIANMEAFAFNNEENYHLLDEATIPEHIIMDSKISELMDVFPDLGSGFLEECLRKMNMDSDAVTVAILEDNLPDELAKMDRTMPKIPPEEPEPDLHVEAAYIGKKPSEHKNMNELLNDKSFIRQQKNILIEKYSILDENDSMYEDDYDEEEEYLDNYVVNLDVDDSEENLRSKNRVKYMNADSKQAIVDESENDNENDNTNASAAKKGNAFCEDPAVLRARREAKFQQKSGHHQHQTNKNKDVVGNPKGQGQDKSVVHNRDNKGKNKSSRANHNRRSGAQWKRSRGMVPS